MDYRYEGKKHDLKESLMWRSVESFKEDGDGNNYLRSNWRLLYQTCAITWNLDQRVPVLEARAAAFCEDH